MEEANICTYIKESLVKRLGLKTTGTVSLAIISFGSKQTKANTFEKTRVSLHSVCSGNTTTELEAIVVPEICIDVLPVPSVQCSHFKGMRLADVCPVNIEIEEGISILIGADYYWNIVTGKQRRLTKRLRAVNTIFGWTLQGMQDVSEIPGTYNNCPSSSSSALLCVAADGEKDITQFWSLEALGIRGAEEENTNISEDLIKECISQVGLRYVARLPWKANDSYLDANKDISMKRLNSLIRRLSRNPVQLLEYDGAIRQLIDDGIAEPVSASDSSGPRVFYLPHQPVYKKESSTTKVRVVFDASAHGEGKPSLNDQLLTGANLLPDVMKVLLNFRLGAYGIVADIEKAFLQISLCNEDRDSHRFMWFETPMETAHDRPDIGQFRMTRVTFGVTCSPFLLCAVIRSVFDREKENFPNACAILREGIYMDDVVVSVASESEGVRICEEAITIMCGASMRLHKWNSNSEHVRGVLKNSNFPLVQKVLGIYWFVGSDELSVPLDSMEGMLETSLFKGTKRIVLQTIARIYDPLGMLGPTIVKLKIFFQTLWKNKVPWDEVFANDLQTQWKDCINSVVQLKEFTFPRAVLTLPADKCGIEVHVFADASSKAYGTAAFVKCISDSGEVNVSLLCAKNRVAPIKLNGTNELTLPKLELTAALMAARLCSYLCKHLKVQAIRYRLWTDSTIALCWIRNDKQRWNLYVQHRVDEIRRLTEVSQWNHCKSNDNPADLLTRGISGAALQKSKLWAHGPDWLGNEQTHAENGNCSPESSVGTMILLTEIEPAMSKVGHPLLRYTDFSTWNRLLRVTAFVYRFIRRVRKRTSGTSQITTSSSLTTTEIQAAEKYWFKYVQSLNFSNEISSLQGGGAITNSSKISQLSPFLDNEGVLRLGGRLQLLDASVDVKHPIILPAKSHIINLIIDDCHQRSLHAGAKTVLMQLRKNFWIIRGLQIVKRRVKACIVCKKLWGPHASEPFAPLPIERITLLRPFDNVGVDFAGPLYCYDVSDEATKVYVAIFTCAAVRAVHLELVRGLSTEHFIMALLRFISRRGVPSTILSDNARTFRRAALELKASTFPLEGEGMQEFLSQRRIKWRFIVERAPWWGGFWERMVRTMKNLLKVTIGKAKLNFEEQRTIMTEVENVINIRPLTYASADPLELSPITPADFLIAPRETGNVALSTEQDANLIRDAWKYRFKYVKRLKRRWQIEYLQLLRSFHSSTIRPSRQLKVGDVVLVADPSRPRCEWKLALVELAFLGRDQRVRACQTRMADGKQFRRPIQLLYPLELQTCPGEDVEK